MRILLYCIFTNDYNKLLPNWLTYTANNFYTDNADILIITDDLTCKSSNERIKVKYIRSVDRATLLFEKFYIHLEVLNEFRDSYDVFAHLQSNCLLTRKVEHNTLPFVYNKLNCFTHLTWPSCKSIIYKSVPQKGSVAYKDLKLYGDMYIHSGMLLGDFTSMHKMCTDCIAMYEIDKVNNELANVPYHDESYLNSWMVDNTDIVNVITGVVDYGSLECFPYSDDIVYHTTKNEAGIKISKGVRLA